MKYTLQYTCATNIGKRSTNQDNLLIDGNTPFSFEQQNYDSEGSCEGDTAHLFAVCDGIGGLGDSANISRNTVELISENLESFYAEEDLSSWMINILDAADEEARIISAKAHKTGGTTATMVAIRGDECVLVNVGDSPAFILQADGGIHELSMRHNMANYKKLAGVEPGPDDGRILLYGVGAGETKPSKCAHIARGVLKNGDMLLLCSDGVTNAFDDEVLARALRADITAKMIADRSAEEEGADNCTAIIIRFIAEE